MKENSRLVSICHGLCYTYSFTLVAVSRELSPKISLGPHVHQNVTQSNRFSSSLQQELVTLIFV